MHSSNMSSEIHIIAYCRSDRQQERLTSTLTPLGAGAISLSWTQHLRCHVVSEWTSRTISDLQCSSGSTKRLLKPLAALFSWFAKLLLITVQIWWDVSKKKKNYRDEVSPQKSVSASTSRIQERPLNHISSGVKMQISVHMNCIVFKDIYSPWLSSDWLNPQSWQMARTQRFISSSVSATR